jgi:signal peptidase II
MSKIKDLLKIFIISLVVVALDQTTKLSILSLFSDSEFEIYKVTFFLNIVLVWNYGISFGVLNDASQNQIILILISLSIIGTLIYWAMSSQDKSIQYPVALIIGGAFGNIVDRIFYGAVIDFIDFYFRVYHFPAFNIADSCIVIGVGILLLQAILEKDTKIRDK